jgi:hypothetical protein
MNFSKPHSGKILMAGMDAYHSTLTEWVLNSMLKLFPVDRALYV